MIKEIVLRYRRFIIVLIHLAFFSFAYAISFFIRFEFILPARYNVVMLKTFPLLLLIKLIVFWYYNIFSGLWRYVSLDDLWQIIKANILSSLLAVFSIMFYHGFRGYPRSVIIIDWLICTLLVAGVRFFTRLFRERYKPDFSRKNKRALIVGAGRAGISTLRECRINAAMEVVVAGFVDDDPLKKGHRIHGLKVFGGREDIPAIVEKCGIEEIIIAIPSAKGEVLRNIISYCEIPGVTLKIVPKLEQLLNGHLELKPRQVKPEDLLGREPVTIDKKEISACLKNKRVLVTGAGGSIGSELCRQIVKFEPEQVILFDHNENDVYYLVVEFETKYSNVKFKTIIGDIKDVGLLKHTFSQCWPEVVFHAAAHKHVPLMEENTAAAVKNNIIGSRNLIYAADHYKVERFVLISTDKAVNPTSVMGATKRIAEMILQAKAKTSKTKFMAVRFGNVLGSDGSVVPLFKKQIEEGGPLTVTHPDVKRYFMSIPEAAQLVIQAGAIGEGGEIFILDMGEQIKIVDIAKNLVALSGLKLGKDIAIEFIGLRPGEKLYEEILLHAEKDKVTRHKKIYVAQPKDFNPAVLRRKVKYLELLAHMMKENQIREYIKTMIPAYSGAEFSPSPSLDSLPEVAYKAVIKSESRVAEELLENSN